MIEQHIRLALTTAPTPLLAGQNVFTLRAPEEPKLSRYTTISLVSGFGNPTHDEAGGQFSVIIQLDHRFSGLEPAREVSDEGKRALDILNGYAGLRAGTEIQTCLFAGQEMMWENESKTARLSQDFEIVYADY